MAGGGTAGDVNHALAALIHITDRNHVTKYIHETHLP
jgi:hypothetical protein